MFWESGYIPPEAKKRAKRKQLMREIWHGIGEFVFIFTVVMLVVFLMKATGLADAPKETWTEAYVICQPGDYVNIRPHPNKKGDVIGRFETGERLYLDGRSQRNYLHLVGLRLETDEGWIHKGYVVSDMPEEMDNEAIISSSGRVAARRSVNGDRRMWLKRGEHVHVFYWTDEWCLTDKGYIRTEYVELERDGS